MSTKYIINCDFYYACKHWPACWEKQLVDLTDLDDLPEKAQDEVRTSLHDVLSSDVDDVTSDGASGVES